MELIQALKKKGFSKWKIAKEINVSWQTVHMWDKGIFKPTKCNEEKLSKLLELNSL